LAVLLKENHGIDQFCAYVHLRDSYDFLNSQKEITYSKLILDEDIQKQYKDEPIDYEYLRGFEEEYGPIWPLLTVDRVILHGQFLREYPYDQSPYTHEEILRIAQVYAKNLVSFLDHEKPDFIFAYQPGAFGTLMLYAIAKKKNIPTLTIVPPVTRNRNVVSERYDRMTWVEEFSERNKKLNSGEVPHYDEARKHITEFRSRPVVYSEVYKSLIKHGKWKQFDFLLLRNFRRTYNYIRLVFSDWKKNVEKRSDYTTIHPYYYFLDRIKRKVRNFVGVDDLYDVYEPEKSFVFYPLHYEPELSILLLSPYDADQVAIVRRLAQSVPAGTCVYVKEHPQMTPFRPRQYYKELKKSPNVRLLRPEISSFDIIRDSRLVAVITGSAGWEATLFGKPVITFGEVFYNAVSSVIRSVIPEELPILVKRQLDRAKNDDEEVTRFLAAIFEDSARCDLLKLWERTDNAVEKREGLREFADLVAKKVRIVSKR
jgi:hypothetical protein